MNNYDINLLISDFSLLNLDETKIIKIQKIFRGYILRLKRLIFLLTFLKKC